MNTDRADAHLDLEDLIAKAAGQPIDDRAREHLAALRALPARGEPVEPRGRRGPRPGGTPTRRQAAQPARPRRTGRRVLAGPGGARKLLVASVAAALVLLGGARR